MVYPENSTNLAVNGQNNSQYYTNCFVVNIDGPINFNATHSLLDDGSDLPISDVNTIRFFYNLGIEVRTRRSFRAIQKNSYLIVMFSTIV